MVQTLDTNGDRVILRLSDGTIMFVYDKYMQLKSIPGRRRTEVKTMEYDDLIIMNDAIRKVYPECPQVFNIKAELGSVRIVTGRP